MLFKVVKRMKNIINKFLSVGDKYMPLRQPVRTSACVNLKKNTKKEKNLRKGRLKIYLSK